MRLPWMLLICLMFPIAMAWSDPAGDVWIGGAGERVPTSEYPHVDLISFQILEDARNLAFEVEMLGASAKTEPLFTSGYGAEIAFENPPGFELRMGKGAANTVYHWATLRNETGVVWSVDSFASSAVTGTEFGVKVSLPRSLFPVMQHEAIVVEAISSTASLASGASEVPVEVRDDMVGGTQQLTLGPSAHGLRVWTDDMPWTNGEDATYLYTVNVWAEEPQVASVHAAAKDWALFWPKTLDLKKGHNAFPVLASVPFQHSHGEVGYATVTVEGVGAGSGLLTLATLDPGQPSGHHPSLYLGSREVDAGLQHGLDSNNARTPLSMSVIPGEMESVSADYDGSHLFWSAELDSDWLLDLHLSGGDGLVSAAFEKAEGKEVSVQLLAVGVEGDGPVRGHHPFSGRPSKVLLDGIGVVSEGVLEVPLHGEQALVVAETGATLVLDFRIEELSAPVAALVPTMTGATATLPLLEVARQHEDVVTFTHGGNVSVGESIRKTLPPGDWFVSHGSVENNVWRIHVNEIGPGSAEAISQGGVVGLNWVGMETSQPTPMPLALLLVALLGLRRVT